MTTSTAGSNKPYPNALLEIRDLRVSFASGRRRAPFRAVDGVSLCIREGSTMGLVGESGSGKSTLARAVLGLVPVESGAVELLGQDITRLSGARRRRLGRQLQAVFQDPNSSLNPSYTVGRSLAEPLRAQGLRARQQLETRTEKLLQDVGMDPSAAARHPRDFSGGQRQRLAIARALMTEPRVVICDEAVSALDLSVQAQILNLLNDLQQEHRISILFISHDIGVVRHACPDVTVLYRGQVMEAGPTGVVTRQPAHPYTRALLLAAPVADPTVQRDRRAAKSAGPQATADAAHHASAGCPFAPRCPFARPQCWESRPELRSLPDGRTVACHRYPQWQSEDIAELRLTSHPHEGHV